MSLLDRHLAFVASLREADLPVSLAEGLDAVHAISRVGLVDRETLRAAYAATTVKRHSHRPAFDAIFDLHFPPLVGDGEAGRGSTDGADGTSSTDPTRDGPADLDDFRDRLTDALRRVEVGDLERLAREAVTRFGRIQGRGPGEQRWSAYNVANRVRPDDLVSRVLAALRTAEPTDSAEVDDHERAVRGRSARFTGMVESDVSRRAAEVNGPAQVARHTVRGNLETLDFTAARRDELARMRREVAPLARKLATRSGRRERSGRSGRLDFRRTVRASLQTGGVPLHPHHRPHRPGRTDLVVLCDVSGSVANFAHFTLLLVYALREQFSRVRAFTFVDDIHEVTDRFVVGGDPGETLSALAASAASASRWGRTSYGRAFTRFQETHADALSPRTNLLILGDARSNYTDLALPALREMEYAARHSWWLNPEHPRHWGTGDSAAREYAAVVPMVPCRNLAQLGDFVRRLG